MKKNNLTNFLISEQVFQGLVQADHETMDNVQQTIKLWVHECYRVFYDRLVDDKDRKWFQNQVDNFLQSVFDTKWGALYKDSNTPTPFGTILTPMSYVEISDIEKLKKQVYFQLNNYNEQVGVKPMNLILFTDAVDNLCRINRIINQPRGNGLLIGLGGSGRSSLTRLASYLSGYEIYQIEITNRYDSEQFHENIMDLYFKCGIENKKMVFLFSDTQIVEESFLEDINSMLNSGEIPNLFDRERLETIYEQCKDEAKNEGYSDIPDDVFSFFISKVRKKMRIVLCMSPVGKAFRDRIRMYPSLVSCTTIIWFSAWPREALKECALHFLNDIEFDVDGKSQEKEDVEHVEEEENVKPKETIKERIANIFCIIHKSVENASESMESELKRYNCVTPTNYLELVSGYLSLLKEKRTEINEKRSKLEKGIDTLEKAGKNVAEMSIELEKQRRFASKANEDCENLMRELMKEKQQADNQKQQVENKRRIIGKEKIECEKIQTEAEKDLAEALPALERANNSLKKLDPKDISELRSYSNPPKNVEMVLCAVMIVLKKTPTYKQAVQVIQNPRGFIQNLLNFDRNHMSKRLLNRIKTKIIDNPKFDPVIVKKTSTAASGLCVWVIAIYTYGEIYKTVKPKMDKLENAKKKLIEQTNKLETQEKKFKVLSDKINGLEKTLTVKSEEKKRIIKMKERTEKKLSIAKQLVEGLKDEKTRWKISIEEFKSQINNLIGDVLLSSAFLSYAGPFDSQFRKDLLEVLWIGCVKENGIPLSSGFNVVDFLVIPTKIQEYVVQGLPQDKFSYQNASLITRGVRWPLIIDPQGQANKWIKNLEKSNHLQITDPNKEDILRTVENCVKFGTPLLIQDVSEEIDSSLDPVISKSIFKKGNQMYMKLGEKLINYNPKFKLYLTTKLPNPRYAPEISTKTTIVNFSVTKMALEDQLLEVLVRKERSELEEQKNEIITMLPKCSTKLVSLEDEILRLTSTKNLLEDESVVSALKESKNTSEDIKGQIEKSEETKKKIEIVRNQYRDSAKRASIFYFILCELGQIDHMYHFSLEGYIELFQYSIDNSSKPKKREMVTTRVNMLNEYHTEQVYTTTCRGLFEKDKLLFAFKICLELELEKGKLDREEVVFFLKGGIVLNKETQMINPCSWLPSESWDNIFMLDRLVKFHEIASNFEEVNQDWEEWYRSPMPETSRLPSEWANKAGFWETMMIIRCVRVDRLIIMIRQFIKEKMKSDLYIIPPTNDISTIYKGSTNATPLLFILSSGVDPISNLRKLAESKGVKLVYLSLGQGQDKAARNAINESMLNGYWVFLANCHLMMSWMKELDKIIEGFDGSKIHPEFRLWLSSKPHNKFPLSLVQRSRKITTEPPTGIRNNMLRLLGDVSFEDDMKDNEEFKRAIFSLMFFHSILLERSKFGTLGWNVVYDFNDSDFNISKNILEMYFRKLEEGENLNWAAIKFLVGEISYGGRVTEENDKKVLNIYTNNSFNEVVVCQNLYKLSDDESCYKIPNNIDFGISGTKMLKDFPKDDLPIAFGQHSNADISSQIINSNDVLNKLTLMNPQSVAGTSSGLEIEEKVLSTANSLLENYIPQKINLLVVKNLAQTALNTVLIQECFRHNELLGVVRNSLINLIKGIKGEIVMSNEVEEVFSYLQLGKVPPLWMKEYPSLKNISSWMKDLKERVEMFRNWSDGDVPKVFSLSRFIFPTGFLTALKQTAARSKAISIDKLQFDFQIMGSENINSYPKEGAYISDLILEGAGWNSNNSCLTEPSPMKLLTKMPVILFKPVITTKKKNVVKEYNSCKIPVYVYPKRHSRYHVVDVDLQFSKEFTKDKWIKRGTALLLSDSS